MSFYIKCDYHQQGNPTPLETWFYTQEGAPIHEMFTNYPSEAPPVKITVEEANGDVKIFRRQ